MLLLSGKLVLYSLIVDDYVPGLKASQGAIDEVSSKMKVQDIVLYKLCPSAAVIGKNWDPHNWHFLEWVITGCNYCPSDGQMTSMFQSMCYKLIKVARSLPGCNSQPMPDQTAFDDGFLLDPSNVMDLAIGYPSSDAITQFAKTYRYKRAFVFNVFIEILKRGGEEVVMKFFEQYPNRLRDVKDAIERHLSKHKK